MNFLSLSGFILSDTKKKGEYVTINDIITSRNTVKQNSNTTSFHGARNLIDT